MEIRKEITIEVSDSWGDVIEVSNRGVLPGTNEKGILISCSDSCNGEMVFTKEDIEEFIEALQKAKEGIS
ncbi:hypothetical protein ICG_06040 [Bacillus cereus BAG1X1-3]|nr:hypothetical protein IIO_06562 [Bacillus cereus VD115]EJS45134.1 hypothetical protein ICG_06040 [Bacillus cereus BAG1X1-3]NUC20473.1 hypothetical protein [Bacillus mycoides]